MESLNALVTRTLFDKHISLAKQLCDELHLSAIVIWHLHDDFWDEKRISKGGIRYSIDGDGRCCLVSATFQTVLDMHNYLSFFSEIDEDGLLVHHMLSKSILYLNPFTTDCED